MNTISADAPLRNAGTEVQARRDIRLLPSNLGPAVKAVVIAVGVVMLVVEITQARKNWYEGNVAIEEERLVRTKQDHERAGIDVARSEERKNVQLEVTAKAQAEAEIIAAIKHVQEGFGSPLEQVAAAYMDRYKELFQKVLAQKNECSQTGRCSEIELLRLDLNQNLYKQLFQSARGILYHALEKRRNLVPMPRSEVID